MTEYLCFDVEASGLDEKCHPIEVAFVDTASSFERSWLIKPTEVWTRSGVWEDQAEALHRIGRDELINEGVSPVIVFAEFLECVGTKRVVSDCPAADGRWLRQLGLAACAKVDLVIDDIDEVARRITWARGVNHDVALMEAHRHAQLNSPKIHRALPDARHNAAVVAYLLRYEQQ